MRKLAEFIMLFVPFAAFSVARLPWHYMSQKSALGENYKTLLFDGELYWEAYFSTALITLGIALALIAIFVGILFLLRNKFKIRRALFYILCIASAVPAAAVCGDKTYALIGHPVPNYAGHTLIMNAEDIMRETILNTFVQNALLVLQIGFFCALLIWTAEFVVQKIRSKKGERACEEG